MKIRLGLQRWIKANYHIKQTSMQGTYKKLKVDMCHSENRKINIQLNVTHQRINTLK